MMVKHPKMDSTEQQHFEIVKMVSSTAVAVKVNATAKIVVTTAKIVVTTAKIVVTTARMVRTVLNFLVKQLQISTHL